MKRYLKLSAVTLLSSFVILFGTPVLADDDVDIQNIVIGLQGDPYFDSDPACVAIQLGSLLLSENLEGSPPTVAVTLFASVEGVGIADAHALNKSKTICATLVPDPDNPPYMMLAEIDLYDVVQGFLNAGGEILACPMCWAVYKDAAKNKRAQLIPKCGAGVEGICSPEPDQVYAANPTDLLLEADKSFDY